MNRKHLGNLILWGCAGMAYFNAFSSLNLPIVASALLAGLPVGLGCLWLLQASPDRTLPTAEIKDPFQDPS